jgi:hypothetical protein
LRTAFTSYEAECSGIEKAEEAVIAVLRAAGKVAARKRIQAWLAATKESVAGRIQLYEILELLPDCQPRDIAEERAGQEPANLKKDRDGLYVLAQPTFLQSPEVKLLGKLDEAYDRAVEEAEKLRAAEVERRRAMAVAKAASGAGDQASSNQETVTPLTEKLNRYDQLKEAIRDTNTRVLAARGASAMSSSATIAGAPTTAADDGGGTTSKTKARVKSPIPHHKQSGGSVLGGSRVPSSGLQGGGAETAAVWEELRGKPETKDVVKEEAAFAPPRTWPDETAQP